MDFYESVSGQKINKGKITIVFSSNVGEEVKEEVRQVWGNNEIQ